MDGSGSVVAAPKTEEEVKKEQELKKRQEILQNINLNQIPALMPDHQLKGMQMTEDPDMDWKLTEFEDANKAKLAVKVWCQGFMFNDPIRMMVADKYAEAMISLKRKGKTEHMEMVKTPQVGTFDQGESQVKKPGIAERLKRIF
jgi:hypothetical protein